MGSGFYSEASAAALEQRGVDPHIATERLKHNEEIPPVPRGRIPKNLTAEQRMARKLRTKKGREVYAKRKGIIEPIFGQIKEVLGFRQFSLRGLAAMRGEWRLERFSIAWMTNLAQHRGTRNTPLCPPFARGEKRPDAAVFPPLAKGGGRGGGESRGASNASENRSNVRGAQPAETVAARQSRDCGVIDPA